MRILVTFAVDAEFAPWRKLRTLEPVHLDGLEMSRTQVGRAMGDFAVTGMGMEKARHVTEIARSVPHTICIASGVYGSLKPSHKVHDCLVASAVEHPGK